MSNIIEIRHRNQIEQKIEGKINETKQIDKPLWWFIEMLHRNNQFNGTMAKLNSIQHIRTHCVCTRIE